MIGSQWVHLKCGSIYTVVGDPMYAAELQSERPDLDFIAMEGDVLVFYAGLVRGVRSDNNSVGYDQCFGLLTEQHFQAYRADKLFKNSQDAFERAMDFAMRFRLQASTPLDHNQQVVLYIDTFGFGWARPYDEFTDGRFEKIR